MFHTFHAVKTEKKICKNNSIALFELIKIINLILTQVQRLACVLAMFCAGKAKRMKNASFDVFGHNAFNFETNRAFTCVLAYLCC